MQFKRLARQVFVQTLVTIETGDGIGPRLQTVPDAIPMILFFFRKTFDVKSLQQVFYYSSARCRWSRLVQGISPLRTFSMEGA